MKDEAPRIAVVTIGDELLSGEVRDDNLSFIAGALRPAGLKVSSHMTIGDSLRAIEVALRGLIEECDLVILTGGLGPTSDDLTREAVAGTTGRELIKNEDFERLIRDFFESFDREMPSENIKQAYIPEGALGIEPAGGTAPGFIFQDVGCVVVALPGVPVEMQKMFRESVIPFIERTFEGSEISLTRQVLTFGTGESDVAERVADLQGAAEVSYGFLARGGPVIVKLTACAPTISEAGAMLDAEQEKLEDRLGLLIYGVDNDTMEGVVGELLLDKGTTVAVAESLTGGEVCGRITNTPGSSRYFKGGVVAYGVESKRELLEIPDAVMSQGTVNRRVAEAMADSVRKVFDADIGVSTTGIAGPGKGGEKKKVGTVCLGLSDGWRAQSWERLLPGHRWMVRNLATMAALNVVRLYLLEATDLVLA